MTSTQDRIIAAVVDLAERMGTIPQLGDILAAVDLSKSTGAAHVAALVKSGRLVKVDGRYPTYAVPKAVGEWAQVQERAQGLLRSKAVPEAVRATIGALLLAASVPVEVAVDGAGIPDVPHVESVTRPFRGRRLPTVKWSVARAATFAREGADPMVVRPNRVAAELLSAGCAVADSGPSRDPPGGGVGSRNQPSGRGEAKCRC